VADFGVAKAVSEATGQQHLTTKGVALGTPTYMAPEQAAADPLTDHRADLYALGVVAYEMLTGEPPFVRTTAQAMMAAHLTEAPVGVTERRGTIPPALATMVMRCLEKKPADRPQRADDLLNVLEGLSTPSGGLTPAETQPARAVGEATRKARPWLPVAVGPFALMALIAAGVWVLRPRGPTLDPKVREPVVVLPFEVRGGDTGLGVDAADRITAAIDQAGLGKVVRLASADGGERFTERLGRRVLRETGAATLVVGTIAQRGDQVEMQAQVVRGSDLTTVWTLGPERASAADPTLALDAIRERVLGAVGWYLSPATEGQTNPGIYQPPPSLEVFRLADKSDDLVRTGRSSEALPLLGEARSKDTTYLAAALSEWSIHYNARRWRPRDSLTAFLEARRGRLPPGEALKLDHWKALLGSPEQEYRAAMELFAADSSQAYQAMWSSVRARRPEEALRYFALRDTTSAWGRDWQAWDRQAGLAYHALGRFEEELALARAAKARDPRAYGHWAREVAALAALGHADEIDKIVEDSYGLEFPGSPARLMGEANREFERHGPPQLARSFAELTLAGVAQWSDSLTGTIDARNLRRYAYRTLGDHQAVWRIFDEDSRRFGAGGLGERILGMRERILMGDTSGALALVDSARSQPLSAFAGSNWSRPGQSRYYGAHILSLLGRKDEAVAMFREALNGGWRVDDQTTDEALQWYWAPIKDYPPFQELVKLKDGS
jgi:tetratricopeptide (TPR) repeat protein